MRRARAALLVVLASGSLAVAAPWVLAADKPAAAPSSPAAASAKPRVDAGERRYDPENITALSRYMETVAQGNQRYVDKDYQGALDTFRKAVALAPRNPLGHYLVGETQLALKSAPDAEAAFKQAESLSDDRNPALRGRILFCLADFKERERKLEEARAAWNVYSEYAARFADAGVPYLKSGDARILAIDEVVKLDAAYVIVRQRIVAERDGGSADAVPKR